jgi:hypothetical protein
MMLVLAFVDGVRFRTEKSGFRGVFAAKFRAEPTSNHPPAALNNEGMKGLVR